MQGKAIEFAIWLLWAVSVLCSIAPAVLLMLGAAAWFSVTEGETAMRLFLLQLASLAAIYRLSCHGCGTANKPPR